MKRASRGLWVVANSHFDPIWRRPVAWYRRRRAAIYRAALDRLSERPDFRYAFSQVLLLRAQLLVRLRRPEEAIRAAGQAIFVWAAVNSRHLGEVAVRWRRRNRPLKSAGPPRICSGALAVAEAPEEIE